MFMRYRGGGIGHKYMRDIEERFENMAVERIHGNSHCKPSHSNDTNVSSTTNNLGGASRDQGRQGGDEPGSDDEECIPPKGGPSTDNEDVMDCDENSADCDEEVVDHDEDFMNCDEDSGDEGLPADFEADFDEAGSDGGYESFGLADP